MMLQTILQNLEEGLTGLVSLALFSTIIARFWQYGKDLKLDTCKELSKLILETAELGSEYWIQRLEPDDDKPEIFLKEFKIVRNVALINNMILIAENFSQEYTENISQIWNQLDSLITGGNFQSQNRPIDYEKALEIQKVAASLTNAIRQGLIHSFTFRGSVKQVCFRMSKRFIKTFKC